MKKILLALAATFALGSAVAHDTDYRHRHGDRGHHYGQRDHDRYVRIPDRVERRVVYRDNKRIVITTRYHCERQRRGHCVDWSKTVKRVVTRRYD